MSSFPQSRLGGCGVPCVCAQINRGVHPFRFNKSKIIMRILRCLLKLLLRTNRQIQAVNYVKVLLLFSFPNYHFIFLLATPGGRWQPFLPSLFQNTHKLYLCLIKLRSLLYHLRLLILNQSPLSLISWSGVALFLFDHLSSSSDVSFTGCLWRVEPCSFL